MSLIGEHRSRWKARLETMSTVAVMIAIGAGMFFVGQSSRPSHNDVRTTLADQRAQDGHTHAADQRAALADQREVLAKAHNEYVDRVEQKVAAMRGQKRRNLVAGRKKGYRKGREVGFHRGRERGQVEGYLVGVDDGTCIADYYWC
jgi:hypothetical protein